MAAYNVQDSCLWLGLGNTYLSTLVKVRETLFFSVRCLGKQKKYILSQHVLCRYFCNLQHT